MGQGLALFGAPMMGGGPLCSITSAVSDPVSAAFDITITFTADITGFSFTEVTVINGSAGALVQVTPAIYTTTITPTFVGPSGTVSVSVAAGVCQDVSGNGNLASNMLQRTWTLDAYLLSLAPTLYLKFNEASGNIINYGSDGGTGTVTGATQGQAGQLGAGEAYLFDGVDDIVSFANAAVPATKALTTQRLCFLINATSLGEGNRGIFATWGNGERFYMTFQSTNRLEVVLVNSVPTSFITTTNNNQVDFLNAWALVFMDYDDAGTRKVRLWRATAGSAVTALTLATQPALTGTLNTTTAALNIGNVDAQSLTFAGRKDFAFASAGLWSPDGIDLTIMNRIRSQVFNV